MVISISGIYLIPVVIDSFHCQNGALLQTTKNSSKSPFNELDIEYFGFDLVINSKTNNNKVNWRIIDPLDRQSCVKDKPITYRRPFNPDNYPIISDN